MPSARNGVTHRRYTTIPPQAALAACIALAVLLLGSAAPRPCRAAALDSDAVRSAARTYARTVTPDARPDATVVQMEPYRMAGEIVAYIAHLGGGGFCLCGADDLVLPVYFYAPEGQYDPNNPGVRCILREIAERTRLYREWELEGGVEFTSRREAIAERRRFWSELRSGVQPERIVRNREAARQNGRTDDRNGPRNEPVDGRSKEADTGLRGPADEPMTMELDFYSLWHQGTPYNDQCPLHPQGPDDHTVVGCVALAMAQLMYYWQWPDAGQGTGTTTYEYRGRPIGDWDTEYLYQNPIITDVGSWTWADRLYFDIDGLHMTGYWDATIRARALDPVYIHNITPEYEAALDKLYNRLTPDETVCTVDFSTGTYDWSCIHGNHKDPPDPNDAEVAELCYHAAVSVDMNFGLLGSASSGPSIEAALRDHFLYDPDVATTAPSIHVMANEIAWLRPLSIGGCGHMWFIYGYDKSTDPDRLFLRDMGWGGKDNGWYTIDSYCPIPDMEHVVYAAPLHVKFVGGFSAGDGSPNEPYLDLNEAAAEAPDGATLIFRTGSRERYSGPLTLDRPMTLKGRDVTIEPY